MFKTTIKEINGDVRKLVSTELADTIETTATGEKGIAVFLQDQTTPILDLHFVKRKGVFQLSVTTDPDSRYIDAVPGHGIIIGDVIELSLPNNFTQSEVIGVVANQIELDDLVGDQYLTGVDYIVSTRDMRVDGSVTPQVFSIKPEIYQVGDITGIIWECQAVGGMDFSSFGSATSLVRGCLLRKKNEDGTYTNIFNWKNNGEFVGRSFDHYFQDKIGNGLHSFAGRVTFSGQENRGVAIRLDGSRNEELQIVVQDNLSNIDQSLVGMNAQGSVTQG